MKKSLRFLFIFLASLASSALALVGAQELPAAANRSLPESGGVPFYRYFTLHDYDGESQNWCIAQGKGGLMYFGNTKGVLIYDGASWKTVTHANKSVVRAIYAAPEGTVYVGGSGVFGYLGTDSKGETAIIPLNDKTETPLPVFTDIIDILKDEQNKIYFFSAIAAFVWDGKKIKTIMPAEVKGRFGKRFLMDGQICISQNGLGLTVLKHGIFLPIPGGDFFLKKNIPLWDMKKRPDGKYLAFSNKSIYLYTPENIDPRLADADRFQPFASDIERKIADELIFSVAAMNGGRFAVSYRTSGVSVIDASGKSIEHYGKDNTSFKMAAYASFQDDKGSLWLGTGNGIAYFETGSPIRMYSDSDGYAGSPLCMIVHKGIRYMGTTNGVYKMEGGRFVPVAGSPPTICWIFFYFKNPETGENKLLVISTTATYELDEKTGTFKEIIPMGGYMALQSKFDWRRLYFSTPNGMFYTEMNGGLWAKPEKIESAGVPMRYLTESPDGMLWATAEYDGVYRIAQEKNLPPSGFKSTHFDTLSGLPSLTSNIVYDHEGKTVFGTTKGFYSFEENSQSFEHDIEMEMMTGNGGRPLFSFLKDKNGALWTTGYRPAVNPIKRSVPLPDGSFKTDTANFKRLPNMEIEFVYADESGDMWFGGSSGLFRYDGAKDTKDYKKQFDCLIRETRVGNLTGKEYMEGLQKGFQYEHNNLYFRIAAPFFDSEDKTLYSFQLQGFEGEWSGWSRQTEKEYTNLPEGDYVFKAKAKNIYGVESTVATYPFSVLPPWYRAWWALAIDALLIYLIVYGIVKWNGKRLARDKKRLEEVVVRRTRDLAVKNQELAASNEEIQQQTEEIAAQRDDIRASYENVRLISDIGREITQHISVEAILDTVYTEVNRLMPAEAFGIGVFNEQENSIEFPGTIENGKKLPFYSDTIGDTDSLSDLCFNEQREIMINDWDKEITDYLPESKVLAGEKPESVLYLPLIVKGKAIGNITVQSFHKNAYNDNHLSMFRNIALYTAIALDNASAYEKLDMEMENVEHEKEKTEKLLLNILPKETAEELKEKGFASTKSYEKVTVLFTDFKGFTQLADKMSPEEVVKNLDYCFRAFDKICRKHKIEKIKTIGDAYMAAGGIPQADQDNAERAVSAALEMVAFMAEWKAAKEAQGERVWEIRIGVHTGPLVAGVVGEDKFAYDIWGDTVNTANRMESSGQPGRVNISEATRNSILAIVNARFIANPDQPDYPSRHWKFEYRGKMEVKGKGKVGMYFVE